MQRLGGYGRRQDMPVRDFAMAIDAGGGTAVVRVCGELDIATAPGLRDGLAGVIEAGALDVTLDLAELEFIDSTGLHVLVGALMRLRANGGDLALRATPACAMRVLEITGLHSLFDLGEADHRPGRPFAGDSGMSRAE